MPKITELSITRRMSTPLQISLVAEHLPAPLRTSLEDLATRQAELAAAEQNLASAKGAAWTEANERVEAARTEAEQALTDYAGQSAASSTAVRDSAAVAFTAAMEAAHGHLQAALDALVEASQACALHHSVHPGKPVLRLDTRAAADSKTRHRIGMVRGELRDLMAQIPDDIDS